MYEVPELSERVRKILLWLIAGAFFMQMLDGTILNTALPVMSRSFDQSPLRMQAVVIAYFLTVAILIPLSGWTADRFGSRRVFLVSLCLFTFGSFLCAASVNFPMLIASRIIQGVGGAMMTPVGRLIAIRLYPREQMVKTLTFITIPALIGPILGPVLGGFFVQFATWHWIFLVNLPLGFFAVLITFFFMPEIREDVRVPFDWVGFLFFAIAMVAISLSLEGAGELHWAKAISLGLFVLGFTCFCAYWTYASRVKYPLFTTELFRNRFFAVGIVGNLFARMSNGTIPYLTPLMFQVALGYSPLQAGLTMVPLAAFGILAKTIIAPLLQRFGYRLFLFINTILLGILIIGMGMIRIETPYAFVLLYLAVLGTVNSMQFTAMNTLTLTTLPPRLQSAGNGLLSVVIQLASSLGVGTAALLLMIYTGRDISHSDVHLLPYFHATFSTMGCIAVFSSALFLFVPSRRSRKPAA